MWTSSKVASMVRCENCEGRNQYIYLKRDLHYLNYLNSGHNGTGLSHYRKLLMGDLKEYLVIELLQMMKSL